MLKNVPHFNGFPNMLQHDSTYHDAVDEENGGSGRRTLLLYPAKP